MKIVNKILVKILIRIRKVMKNIQKTLQNIGIKKDGISHQEKTYISAEVASKNAESVLWGTMMGPFGGCFSLRKKLWEKIPSHFLVDDFFINMHVLQKGFKSINEPNAIVFEDVSNDLSDEFRRKIRISSGNFQNLFHYKHLLFDFSWIARLGISVTRLDNF